MNYNKQVAIDQNLIAANDETNIQMKIEDNASFRLFFCKT